MSKWKRKKKRSSGNRQSPPPSEPHEVYQHGPFQLGQMGRMASLSTNWGTAEHEKYVGDVLTDRPQHKERINEKVEEILSIVRRYDLYDLIAAVAANNTFVNPESYTESSQKICLLMRSTLKAWC